VLLSLVFMTCKSPPPPAAVEPAVEPPVEEEAAVFAVEEEEPASDSITVSQEVYDFTLTEVKHFVDNLNLIIRTQNYSSWRNALSDQFFARVSSQEFLTNVSEANALRSKKIVLKTAYDYFKNVVVPSRSDSQVDEIDFTAKGTVKVYYLERKEKGVRRLRLYELEKSGDIWKIID